MNLPVFIGNYSNRGIFLLSLNNNKQLNLISQTKDFENCSYVCTNGDYLYSVVEIQGDEKVDSGYVIAYKIKENHLEFINSTISYGKGPCFSIVDTSRQILYIANYTDGSFVAFKLEKDGIIGKKLYYKKFTEISHVHHIQFSKDYKTIYIIDLGTDSIIEYSINYEQDKLDLTEVSKFQFPKKSEPRHMVIDQKDNIYVVTETSCELYKLNHNSNNQLILLDKKSILPEKTIKEKNFTGCAIKILTEIQYIYVSVRGHNSISVFDINNDDIRLIQNISCEGNGPRDISFDKNNKYLMCANQLSNNISIFNVQNGRLTYEDKYDIESPSCIIVNF